MNALVVLVVVFLCLPIVVVIVTSFGSSRYLAFPPQAYTLRWYSSIFTASTWMSAAWNSVRIGLLSASLASVLGIAGAIALTRGRLRGSRNIAALIVAPMMLPHIIIAIGLYPTMLDLGLSRSLASIVIAHAVIGVPIVFISVSSALRSYDGSLETAAMTLGAGWWRTFRCVTLPMIRPGILTGFALSFTTSFDELILALFLTGVETRTLPRLVWEHLAYEVSPMIAAVATAILILSLCILCLIVLFGRNAGSPFGER